MVKSINWLKKNKLFLIIIIILIIIFSFIEIKNMVLKIMFQKKHEEYVEKYSKEYNVDENLIFAIIKAESNFDKEIVSNKNAKGLMQIMYSTAKDVANELKIDILEDDLYNEEINIKIGTKYISDLINKYKNIELACAAYNAGSGNVDKWIDQGVIHADGSDIEKIPFKETNNYVRKVLRNFKIYNNIYGSNEV